MSAVINVRDYGARGNGRADDQDPIQRAILEAITHGSLVFFPMGDYLLDTCQPADHPWQFSNLLVGSGVTLLGATGARLIQGPGGRHPLPAGADWVRNTVLAIGLRFSWIRWQDPSQNGGWLAAEPVRANENVVRPPDST